jgi:transposase
MGPEVHMPRHKTYTKEYKQEVVGLIERSGKSPYEVAHELGLPTSCVRRWFSEHEIDQGRGPEGALTTEEREELRRLRRENLQLKMERFFLKKATAFFAKESQ